MRLRKKNKWKEGTSIKNALGLEELLGIEVPVVGELKSSDIPSPEEYQYWSDRENRTFYIDYEIDDKYALIELCKAIVRINEDDMADPNPKPIRIFIHSYGGDINQANFLCDLIEASRTPVITIAMGVAMSAGFLILLSGHKRYAFPRSSVLVHTGSAVLQGTSQQVEEAQKNYKKQLEEMKSYIMRKTTIDTKTFNKNKDKDWYLTSDELLKYGVVDELITDISVLYKELKDGEE